MLRQFLLQVSTHFFSMLSMTISHREEMWVLKTTKVRDCDPSVLIYFFRIRRWNSCLRSKCKFGNSVSIHLLWVARIVREWLQVSRVDLLLPFWFVLLWYRLLSLIIARFRLSSSRNIRLILRLLFLLTVLSR